MGRGSIRGDDRSAVIISLLALQSAGGDAEHCTVWGTVHAAAEIATHVCTAAGTPVRSHPLYQLPRRVKPVCAGGLPLQAVDLSVLPDKEPIPPHYAENITEQNLPAELIPQYVTCEYELPSVPDQGPPCFLFVVDTCSSSKEEIAELADSLQQSLQLLPPEALVGLIVYGTNVSVYELASENISKSYIFRGNKEYSPREWRSYWVVGVVQRHGPRLRRHHIRQNLDNQHRPLRGTTTHSTTNDGGTLARGPS